MTNSGSRILVTIDANTARRVDRPQGPKADEAVKVAMNAVPKLIKYWSGDGIQVVLIKDPMVAGRDSSSTK